jgi:flagellar hook-associated protein 2
MAIDYLSAINQKGSGLNITQIVDSIVQAETAPQKDQINDKIEEKTLEISAMGEVATELDKLKTNTLSFANKTLLKTSSSSTAASLKITSPSSAVAFQSDINISSLATSQTLEFSGFSLPSSSVGSGVITVDFGNWITNGTASDSDSLYNAGTTLTASTSLGTPNSHSNLGGVIRILTATGGDQSSTTFTVVGTDMAGNTITENITGGGDGVAVTTSNVFKSVTSISPGSTIGTGAVKIGHVASSFGQNTAKASSNITIGTSTNTLAGVAGSLNAISGVTANIINKGDGTYSLVVRSDTGVNNAIKLTVSEDASDTGLSTFDTTSDNSSHQTTAATDASLTVDGVSVSRSTNSITNLFDGYTLDLTSTTTNSFRVSSSLDKGSAFTTMSEFIETLNDTRKKLNELTIIGTETVEAGPLARNVAVNAIKKEINDLLTAPINGFGSDNLYLSELGIRTNQDGTLTINETTFNSQLDANSTVYDAIFNTMFSSSSSYLKVEASSATSRPTPGKYSYQSDGSSATLDGSSMTSSIDSSGNSYFLSNGLTKNTRGIKITENQAVSSAYVYYGESLVDQISEYLDNTLNASGKLTEAKSSDGSLLSDYSLDLAEVDERVISLTERYKSQFSAMESTVTSLKSTGDYLTNMMDAWNKDK